MTAIIVVFLISNGLSAFGPSLAYAASESTPIDRELHMALPGEKCRIGSSHIPVHWTKTEKWAWNEICEGRSADFNRRTDEILDPRKTNHADKWEDERRTLSPGFLKTILLYEPFRSATPFSGVRIIGAHVLGDINLNEAPSARPFDLQGSLVSGSVFMVRFSTPSIISFHGTKIVGELKLNAVSTGGSLFLWDAELREVDLISAKIGDLLVLDGTTVTGKLNMDKMSTEGSLYMRDGKFADVVLRGARIGGQVSMDRAKVAGILNMDGVSTRDGLLMSRGKFGDVNLRGARIGGQVSLDGAQVAGNLNFSAASIETAILMNKAEFDEVELVGAKIGNQMSMVKSQFQGKFYMDSTTIGSDLYMRQSEFDGSTSLLFVEIGSNLDLRGAKLNVLDLRGTRIDRELILGMVGEELEWRGCTGTSSGTAASRFNLQNVTIDALQDTANDWPDCLDRELKGFDYGRLGGFDEGSSEAAYMRGSDWFVSWLNRDSSFSPQPYQHLARVLDATGHGDMADDVLFASLERERSESGPRQLKWWTLSLLRWTVGYGYGWGYLCAFGWVVVLAGLGTVVLYGCNERDGNKRRLGFWYSLDMLLPVIHLREHHYDVDLSRNARYYFFLQKMLGYVLVTTAIAGLSDLAN